MVNSSENSSVHQVLMENMSERGRQNCISKVLPKQNKSLYFLLHTVRLEHHNSKDHTARIVDMITSETMKLCATSSLDNTIRIWDQENILLKV